MKRIFLLFAVFLTCQVAYADVVFLKNGEIIEGKITQVRGIFIRVQPEYGRPFREFLIENVAHIEQTDPDEISHLAVRNIHQRALNKARDQSLREVVDQRAVALIEQAMQNSKALSLDGASDQVKAVAREKASVLIGEAVKRAETPGLIDASTEIKSIAQLKASGVIEQAVKDVETLPLRNAPEGVQKAAKKAATTLIEGAVVDAETQTRRRSSGTKHFTPALSAILDGSRWKDFFTGLELTAKDGMIGGLLVLMLLVLLREKARKREKIQAAKKHEALASRLKELDSELEAFDKVTTRKKSPRVEEESWMEKRKYTRVKREFPVSLILDKVKPISAVVKNISLGGAYCLCHDVSLLKLGDRCGFKSSFLDTDVNFGVNGTAEVVRIRPDRGLGLKFSDLNEESLNYLLKF